MTCSKPLESICTRCSSALCGGAAQSLNQFYIFFKVMGRSFDQCKEALLQVREEASVLTCSDAMLPVHGADRDMLRLQGETVDNYRRRLAMKGAISEMAGLNSGIRYLAQAFGYDEVNIEPGKSRITGRRPLFGLSEGISCWMTGHSSCKS